MIFVKYTVKGFPFPFNQRIFHVRFDFTDTSLILHSSSVKKPFFLSCAGLAKGVAGAT